VNGARLAPERGDPLRLARALCHEVGNALAAVRLSAHLLSRSPSRGDLAESSRELAAVAARAGAALGQLRVLLAGAPPAPSLVAEPEAVLASVRHALAAAGGDAAGLELTAAAGLPEVRADAEALHHLLVSLVFAAWDAVPEPGPVRVSADLTPDGVAFAVTDTGPVLRALEPDPAFEPGGRGLGLAVAATLVARWEGALEVRSGRAGNRVELRLSRA
jgi:C4-dicarboxylate-specific signal transduction histidine kinase